MLVAGFVQLRGWRRGRWLRATAWAGAWVAGFELMYQAAVWGEYPARYMTPSDSGPAVVSWGELAICAAWLALGAVMTLILARPANGWEVSDTSRQANLWPRGASDLQP
jgi:hypothetical protein